MTSDFLQKSQHKFQTYLQSFKFNQISNLTSELNLIHFFKEQLLKEKVNVLTLFPLDKDTFYNFDSISRDKV